MNKKSKSKTKKIETKENLKDPVYLTFFTTFLFLGGTTLITFLAAFSANDEDESYLKQAFVSETAVNVVASITYYYFIVYLYANKLSLQDITPIRYLDWALTTPLLLISFTLFVSYGKDPGEGMIFRPLIYIIALNLGMLLFGYLGETGKFNFYLSWIIGFGYFAAMIYFLWEDYVKDSDEESRILFYVFASIWGLYGLSYLLPLRPKNISYNILDLISKGGFGLYVWLNMITKNPTQRVSVRD
jgi:sensory rhodopsin